MIRFDYQILYRNLLHIADMTFMTTLLEAYKISQVIRKNIFQHEEQR